MPGRVGAAATKSGRFGTTGRAVPGEQDGKVYARNRCREASSSSASSNPVDLGWCAVRTQPGGGHQPGGCRGGELSGRWYVSGLAGRGEGLRRSHDETAGAKPGASPVDRTTANVGTTRTCSPPGIGALPAEGCGWGGAVVVLRDRESRSHGEGRQREEAEGDCDVRRRAGEYRRRR